MNELTLIKSEQFGEIKADIYSNGNEMFMTINQLAACLEYADRSGVQKIVDRNPCLNNPEFSGWDELSLPQGGTQNTRIFTEDGIYEVTMLSSQPKAKEFRAWIRGILKALRQGTSKPACIEDILIQSLQEMKEVKNQIQAVNTRVDNIGEVIALDTTSWRDDAHKLIIGVARKMGGNDYIKEVNKEVYQLVDHRGGVSLETRLTNKRNRMAGEGACKSKRDKLNKLDVIAEDKKLVEIYVAIVKEMAVKNGVALNKEEH